MFQLYFRKFRLHICKIYINFKISLSRRLSLWGDFLTFKQTRRKKLSPRVRYFTKFTNFNHKYITLKQTMIQIWGYLVWVNFQKIQGWFLGLSHKFATLTRPALFSEIHRLIDLRFSTAVNHGQPPCTTRECVSHRAVKNF